MNMVCAALPINPAINQQRGCPNGSGASSGGRRSLELGVTGCCFLTLAISRWRMLWVLALCQAPGWHRWVGG